MIFSYDFQNDVRDVSPVLEVVRANSLTLFSIAQIGNPVANRTAEWCERSLGVSRVEATAVTDMVLTMSADAASKLSLGMLLSPLSSADRYSVTAVSGTSVTVAKIDSSMNAPVKGFYMVTQPGVVEGSVEGAEVFNEAKTLFNNTQVFRAEAKLTRTAMGTSTYDNANSMDAQVEVAMYDIYAQMNDALWRGYKKLGSTSTPGSMGGMYQFCSANQVDAGAKVLSQDLINSAIKLIKDKGGKANTIVCNPAQISRLTKLYENQIIVTQQENIRGVYVNQIRNPYDGSVLQVVTDDMCPANDVWLLDSSKIEVCPYSNGALSDSDTTPAGFDGARRTVLGEYTVKFHNGGECFASLRNLG